MLDECKVSGRWLADECNLSASNGSCCAPANRLSWGGLQRQNLIVGGVMAREAPLDFAPWRENRNGEVKNVN